MTGMSVMQGGDAKALLLKLRDIRPGEYEILAIPTHTITPTQWKIITREVEGFYQTNKTDRKDIEDNEQLKDVIRDLGNYPEDLIRDLDNVVLTLGGNARILTKQTFNSRDSNPKQFRNRVVPIDQIRDDHPIFVDGTVRKVMEQTPSTRQSGKSTHSQLEETFTSDGQPEKSSNTIPRSILSQLQDLNLDADAKTAITRVLNDYDDQIQRKTEESNSIKSQAQSRINEMQKNIEALNNECEKQLREKNDLEEALKLEAGKEIRKEQQRRTEEVQQIQNELEQKTTRFDAELNKKDDELKIMEELRIQAELENQEMKRVQADLMQKLEEKNSVNPKKENVSEMSYEDEEDEDTTSYIIPTGKTETQTPSIFSNLFGRGQQNEINELAKLPA